MVPFSRRREIVALKLLDIFKLIINDITESKSVDDEILMRLQFLVPTFLKEESWGLDRELTSSIETNNRRKLYHVVKYSRLSES